MNDLRFALRQLLKHPGFTTVAVFTLALGIGANTAIFTVINTLMLRSLPVGNPEELVQISANNERSRDDSFAYPLYEQLRDGNSGLSGLFAAGGVTRERFRVSDAGAAEAEFIRAQPVTGNFFSVLGVPPAMGRTFWASDDAKGNAEPLAVISYSFWQQRFGGDASVIGKTISFQDVPFTIIGVTPPGFFGFQPGEDPDLWWPLQNVARTDRDPAWERLSAGTSWLRLMGRVPAGVNRREAEAQLQVIFRRWLEDYASTRARKWTTTQQRRFFEQRLELLPGSAGWTELRGQFRKPLLILMTVVGVVLLIACANVASLLLARAAARQREFSIRAALGAGRLRLIRQLLTESLLLATLGGALGLILAQAGTHVLLAFMRLEANPISFHVAPDTRVLLFTTGTALLTGILFGLAPALRSSRQDLAPTLKGTAGSLTGGPSRQRLNQALVVVQVALSLVLLIGAGLFFRTLSNLKGMDMGFAREALVQFRVEFTEALERPRWIALYQELLARMEATPGVRSATLFNSGFLSGASWTDRVLPEGYAAAPDEDLSCHGVWAGPRFCETFGMQRLAGRDIGVVDERLAASTNANTPRTALINEAMARRYFGDANPLGKRFYFAGRESERRFEIVGVVRNAKYRSLRQEEPPTFYVAFFQQPHPGVTFVVRAETDARAVATSLPAIAREVGPMLRVRNVRTMEDVVNASVHQERVVAQLGGFFSVFALALACLGLYGVLSFAVVQRTREIGVRVALGAQRRNILSLVVGQGVKLAFMGALIGIAGAFAATRLLSSLLFGVTATDPLTFIGVSLLLVLVAVVASWLPARRAAKVHPMEALRYE